MQHDDDMNFNGWGVYYRLAQVTGFEYWYIVVPNSTQYQAMSVDVDDVTSSLRAMLHSSRTQQQQHPHHHHHHQRLGQRVP